MDRRQVLTLGPAGLGLILGACASADKISFDRGSFAIDFENLAIGGLTLLNTAIARNTKAGVMNGYAQGLAGFRDDLQRVKENVEKMIREAPEKSRDLNSQGLSEVAGIISKAVPLILPLLAAL